MSKIQDSSITLQDITTPSSSNKISEQKTHDKEESLETIGFFEKYLTAWVLVCMAVGIAIGHFIPSIPSNLQKLSIAEVSLPIAVLVWGMILPMMMQIDFASLRQVWRSPRAIFLTTGINYLVQPFVMYGLATLFFYVIFRKWLTAFEADQYVAGAVILGGSPCTAMVFVWSVLVNGDPSYTLTQVAVNDLLILILFSPTVKLLLKVSNVEIPWVTLLLSVGVFVLIPLLFGTIARFLILRFKSAEYLNEKVLPKIKPFTICALLLTLILIFMFQADAIISHPINMLMIAVPVTLMTCITWSLAYGLAYLIKLPANIAGPASMIAGSNFFELAVAVTISLFGPKDPSVLVTTVGVLVEVPVMLSLCFVCNRTKWLFARNE
uniref:Arsenical-resistance protein n=1 Tax=Plectus sambesii TaxID=2011161 RepID=A0A914XDH6_9BILA